MKRKIDVEEFISGVYWNVISENDNTYAYICSCLKELCVKYGIVYTLDKDLIFDKFSYEKSGHIDRYMNLESVAMQEVDVVNNIDEAELLFWKYRRKLEWYRDLFVSYVKKSEELSFLINGSIEDLEVEITSVDWEKRKEAQLYFVMDEDGWPLEDKEGQEIVRMETQEEIEKRLLEEKKEYEKKKKLLQQWKENLKYWMEFFLLLPSLSVVYSQIQKALLLVEKKRNQIQLASFYENTDFMLALNEIMQHSNEKECYRYHGTTCVEDAESSLQDGLYMASSDLDRTSYSEMTPTDLLLYYRGFAGEVGKDAVVVIREPYGVNIARPLSLEEKKKVRVTQSGLGGFSQMNYVIPPEYIVGYVNKRDKVVVFRDSLSLEAHQSR